MLPTPAHWARPAATQAIAALTNPIRSNEVLLTQATVGRRGSTRPMPQVMVEGMTPGRRGGSGVLVPSRM